MLIELTGTRALFLTAGDPIPGVDVDPDHGVGPVGHQNDNPQPGDLWKAFANASDQSVVDELARRGFRVRVIQTGAERDQAALGRADEVNHDDGGGKIMIESTDRDS
jgi:hypothetical protein